MEARKTRIKELDIIRGFALFGVLLVNMTMMHTSRTGFGVSRMDLEGINLLSARAIELLFQGKFYTIFSILFGLGFYLFMNRNSRDSSLEMKPFFLRRMWILIFFGVVHMVLVWHGDILHTYGVIGLILLWKVRKSPEEILRGAIIWLSLAAVLNGAFTALGENPSLYEEMITSKMIPYADEIYGQGSYLGLVAFRLLYEVPNVLFNLIFLLPKILGLFYLGFYLGKKQVFENLWHYREKINKIFRISAPVSLLLMVILQLLDPFTGGMVPYYTLAFMEGFTGELLTLTGSAFYISALLILLRRRTWETFLNPLQYMGKMALTNYLFQTLFWTWVFNGYGLGLFGKLPYWSFIPLALSFFLLQILLSKIWLQHRTMGPMESLWRRWTYGIRS